ncbi:MAG: hypothetical protein R2716_14265 [Microthrixaceae bacterium]
MKGTTVRKGAPSSSCRRSRTDAHRKSRPEHLGAALEEMRASHEWTELALDEQSAGAFEQDTASMVERYFSIEDPRVIEPVGVELMLSSEIGGVTVRGSSTASSRTPRAIWWSPTTRPVALRGSPRSSRLGGVHFYAFLCNETYGGAAVEDPAALRKRSRRSSPRPPPSEVRSWPAQLRLGDLGRRRTGVRTRRLPANPTPLCATERVPAVLPVVQGDPEEARPSASNCAPMPEPLGLAGGANRAHGGSRVAGSGLWQQRRVSQHSPRGCGAAPGPTGPPTLSEAANHSISGTRSTSWTSPVQLY